MSDITFKACPKIKQIQSSAQDALLEMLGLSYEIEDLLKLGRDFCEFNLRIDEVGTLFTLFQLVKEKEHELSQKLDEYFIEQANLK